MSDLMRRTRAGMGFCQGGECSLRVLSALGADDPARELKEFHKERWKGVSPVLVDDQLRQEAFKAHLFRTYGLDHSAEQEAGK